MKHSLVVRQRGVFTIISTLAAVTVLLFVGLVVDAGRMMLVHAELQNAADACALAAAGELNNSPNGTASTRAALAGKQIVANWSLQNFQSEPISSADVALRFSTSLNGTFSETGSASARVAECRITHPGLSSVLMKLADLTNLTPQAVARAGLVPGGRVCTLPLALRNQTYAVGTSYTLAPYLLLTEHSGGALKDDASYNNLIANWGSCLVSTLPHIVTLGDLSASVIAAIDARHANDPEVGAGTGTTPRRVLAVPLVDSTTKLTDRRWACIELVGNGYFKFLGYANDGTFVPPATTKPWCIASGQPLGIHKLGTITYTTGPFVPALLQ